MKPLLLLAALALLSAATLPAADLPTKQDDRLQPVYQSNRVWNGYAATPEGRAFVCYPGADGPGVGLEEIVGGTERRAYPDEGWNRWKPGQDFSGVFVAVNAVRVGPDGKLYVVDAGSTGPGEAAVPGAGRIIVFDLATDHVARVYPLDKAAHAKSYIDDLRFNGPHAYITDVGEPGLIVLDLATGDARRVLDGDPTTTQLRPLSADGKLALDKTGKPRVSHTDQLEVSPDGKYLYYLPCSGPTARIETRFLDDASLPAEELARHAENWLETPTCGGTAIDAQGNLYYSDTDARRILKITPDKHVNTLVADPRLMWSDAMWIDRDGFLWLPATQQEFTPGFTGGKQEVEYPVWIYKLHLGAKPAPNDHS